MPFREPSAFNCIYCHYENKWQLKTQMCLHVVTEQRLMCLMIFAAFDSKALVRNLTNHGTNLTY